MRFSEIEIWDSSNDDNATKNDIFEMKSECVHWTLCKKAISQAVKTLLVKNNYYESSTLTAKKGPMKTAAQNRSANTDGSVLRGWPTFSLVNALVYVRHSLSGLSGLESEDIRTFIILGR